LRIVLVQPEFFGTEKAIIEEYKRSGFDVYPIVRRIGFTNPLLLLKSKLGFDVSRELTKYWSRLSAEIESICFKQKPDALVVTQGMQLIPDAVERIKKHCITVLSMSDRISSFPELLERLKHYDIVYSYSKEEASILHNQGISVGYSHMGYDSEIYTDIDCNKNIDICFVGTMYKERRMILEKLAYDFADKNIEFYGKYVSLVNIKQYLVWLNNNKLRKAFKNKNLTTEEVNLLYNHSKICLNINRANMSKEWTTRLLEILGTNSFQIVEKNDVINRDFGHCLCQYSNYDDLREKIKFYLENDAERKAIAQKGYDKVRNNYTLSIEKKVYFEELKSKILSLQGAEKRYFC